MTRMADMKSVSWINIYLHFCAAMLAAVALFVWFSGRAKDTAPCRPLPVSQRLSHVIAEQAVKSRYGKGAKLSDAVVRENATNYTFLVTLGTGERMNVSVSKCGGRLEWSEVTKP